MTEITDDYMRDMLGKAHPYSVLLLKKGPNYQTEGDRSIIWEHGRRNFALRAAGQLAVVVPLATETEMAGIGLFTTGVEETRALMLDDPAVKTGWLTFEVYAGRSFPGDGLPG